MICKKKICVDIIFGQKVAHDLFFFTLEKQIQLFPCHKIGTCCHFGQFILMSIIKRQNTKNHFVTTTNLN
jgi:hypothetical protein